MDTWKHRLLAGGLALLLGLSLAPGARAASAYDRPGQKLAALTFDDGPGEYSDAILDTLHSRSAKATFFLNGYKIDRYADQVRRMAAEGHQIGNHTYDHPDLAGSSDREIRDQLAATARKISAVTGLTGTGDTGFYLRPPYGSWNSRVATAANVPVIWCTVDAEDWKDRDADRLVDYVGTNLKDGDIVVMHETQPSTARGLGRLLDTLRARGFELVTVEELFWRRGVTPKAGSVYRSAPNTGVDRCARDLYFDEKDLSRHWAYPAICFAEEKGLMTENRYGEFTPNFPLTRGMFVTALGRLSGVENGDASSDFRDIPAGHYAAPYAAWAKANGIMLGKQAGDFGINDPLTRQEMAAALARYARYCGVEPADGGLTEYSDRDAIAPWAREGVADCTVLGFLDGAGGKFHPRQAATRAMGAMVLQRLYAYPWPAQTDTDQVEPADTTQTESAATDTTTEG